MEWIPRWAASKIALDQRILEARKARAVGDDIAPMPAWVLHDFRRYLSTTMHEGLGIPPHIVESILGHVGHQAGTPVATTGRLTSLRRRRRWHAGVNSC